MKGGGGGLARAGSGPARGTSPQCRGHAPTRESHGHRYEGKLSVTMETEMQYGVEMNPTPEKEKQLLVVVNKINHCTTKIVLYSIIIQALYRHYTGIIIFMQIINYCVAEPN